MKLRRSPENLGGRPGTDSVWPGDPEHAKVVHLELEGRPRDTPIEERYTLVLLIVLQGGAVLGHVWLKPPPEGVLTAAAQVTAAADKFGWMSWHSRYRDLLDRAARGPAPPPPPNPTIAVAVCTRDRPDALRRCLERLVVLEPAPDEMVVVDNCPSDDRTREVCSRFPVRYIVEPFPGQTRARNRAIVETTSDLIAFTDDDCEPDEAWLAGLAEPFSDPLVLAVTGYVGPIELEEPAQVVFEQHYGFGRSWTRTVYDSKKMSPTSGAAVAGAGANMILRRQAFELLGLYPEYLGPGTPARSSDDKYFFYRILATGYHIVHEPSRKVWHRHRADHAALERIMNDYGVAEFAYATLCLLRHRELSALRIFGWWLKHFVHDLVSWARRRPGHLDFRLSVAELRGAVIGPLALVRSLRSRRKIPPLELPQAPTDDAAEPPRISVHAGLPQLSVAVATYNRREALRVVLEHLGRQTYPADRYEVLVVVDGSTDGSAEMARSLELPYTLRVLEQENRGLAATRNRGAREASSAIVVFLDDDIHATPRFVESHATAHRDADVRPAVLGYCPPAFEPETLWATTLRTWWEEHYRNKAERAHQWTFLDFADGNVSISRELLLSLGGYDEDFDGGRRHDWELGARLLEADVPFVYCPDAKALHAYDPRFSTAVRNQHDSGRLDVLLASKHPRLTGQLPLGAVAWRFAEEAKKVERLVSSGTHGIELRARRLRPTLWALENVRARGAWHRRAYALLHDAYTIGVVDAYGGLAAARKQLDPARLRADVTKTSLRLDGDEFVRIPPGCGSVDIGVEIDGRVLGEVDAMPPGIQWNWDFVLERLALTTNEPARLYLASIGITRVSGMPLSPTQPELQPLALEGHG